MQMYSRYKIASHIAYFGICSIVSKCEHIRFEPSISGNSSLKLHFGICSVTITFLSKVCQEQKIQTERDIRVELGLDVFALNDYKRKEISQEIFYISAVVIFSRTLGRITAL